MSEKERTFTSERNVRFFIFSLSYWWFLNTYSTLKHEVSFLFFPNVLSLFQDAETLHWIYLNKPDLSWIIKTDQHSGRTRTVPLFFPVLPLCWSFVFLSWRTWSFLMWSQRVRWSRSWSSLSTWWIQVTESCWTIQTPFSTSTWLTTCRTRWGHLLCGLDHVGTNHSFWHFLCWRLPLGHTSVRPDSKEAYIAGSKGHDQRKGDYPQCSSSEGFLLRWTQSRVDIWSPSVLFHH